MSLTGVIVGAAIGVVSGAIGTTLQHRLERKSGNREMRRQKLEEITLLLAAAHNRLHTYLQNMVFNDDEVSPPNDDEFDRAYSLLSLYFVNLSPALSNLLTKRQDYLSLALDLRRWRTLNSMQQLTEAQRDRYMEVFKIYMQANIDTIGEANKEMKNLLDDPQPVWLQIKRCLNSIGRKVKQRWFA